MEGSERGVELHGEVGELAEVAVLAKCEEEVGGDAGPEGVRISCGSQGIPTSVLKRYHNKLSRRREKNHQLTSHKIEFPHEHHAFQIGLPVPRNRTRISVALPSTFLMPIHPAPVVIIEHLYLVVPLHKGFSSWYPEPEVRRQIAIPADDIDL